MPVLRAGDPVLACYRPTAASFGIEEADGEPEIIAKVEDRMRRMGAIDAHIPAIRYLLAVDPRMKRSPPWSPRHGASNSSMPCWRYCCARHSGGPWCWSTKTCTGATPARKRCSARYWTR